MRWLRPALQNPQTATTQPSQVRLEGLDGVRSSFVASSAEPAAQPWPATLPEQMRAMAELLAASPQPLGESDIATRFKGRGPWKKSLPRILDTLEALGRARREGEGWRA